MTREDRELLRETREEMVGDIVYFFGWSERKSRKAVKAFLYDYGGDFRAEEAGKAMLRALGEVHGA